MAEQMRHSGPAYYPVMPMGMPMQNFSSAPYGGPVGVSPGLSNSARWEAVTAAQRYAPEPAAPAPAAAGPGPGPGAGTAEVGDGHKGQDSGGEGDGGSDGGMDWRHGAQQVRGPFLMCSLRGFDSSGRFAAMLIVRVADAPVEGWRMIVGRGQPSEENTSRISPVSEFESSSALSNRARRGLLLPLCPIARRRLLPAGFVLTDVRREAVVAAGSAAQGGAGTGGRRRPSRACARAGKARANIVGARAGRGPSGAAAQGEGGGAGRGRGRRRRRGRRGRRRRRRKGTAEVWGPQGSECSQAAADGVCAL